MTTIPGEEMKNWTFLSDARNCRSLPGGMGWFSATLEIGYFRISRARNPGCGGNRPKEGRRDPFSLKARQTNPLAYRAIGVSFASASKS